MLGLWLSQELILTDYDAGLEAAIRVYTVGSNAPICKHSLSEQKLETSHYDWHHLASSQGPGIKNPVSIPDRYQIFETGLRPWPKPDAFALLVLPAL